MNEAQIGVLPLETRFFSISIISCLYILALLRFARRLSFQNRKCIKRKHKVIVRRCGFRPSQDEKKSLIKIVFYHGVNGVLFALCERFNGNRLFGIWMEHRHCFVWNVLYLFHWRPLLIILLYITLLKWLLVEYCYRIPYMHIYKYTYCMKKCSKYLFQVSHTFTFI